MSRPNELVDRDDADGTGPMAMEEDAATVPECVSPVTPPPVMPLTEAEMKSDEQHRKMGAAYSSIAMQILSLCLSETLEGMHKSMHPEVARQTKLRDLLLRLDKRAEKSVCRRGQERRLPGEQIDKACQ